MIHVLTPRVIAGTLRRRTRILRISTGDQRMSNEVPAPVARVSLLVHR